MTREEEIQKAIEEEFADHLFEDESDYIMQSSKFKKGIKWADEHPRKGLWDVEKVTKFIKDNVREYHKSGVFHVDDFINDLRKAMED